MENTAKTIDLGNEPATHRTVTISSDGVNHTYNFYPIADFSSGAFFRGLIFKTSSKSYFSPARCYGWLLISIGTPIGLYFGWDEIVRRFERMSETITVILMIVVGFCLLGAVIITVKTLEYIFWPLESVGNDSAGSSGAQYKYFEKGESTDEKTKTKQITYFCVHPTDWENHKSRYEYGEWKSPIRKVIGGSFYLLGWIIFACVMFYGFSWVVSLPLNSILLLVIIYLLINRQN